MASGHGHGSMSLSMKFIRLLIVLFNLAFIVVGVILLAIGVYVVRDPKLQQLRPLLNPDLTSEYSQSISYIEAFAIGIIVLGGVLLIIGFLGKKFKYENNLF
jgi:H+/Cl- antiporter ClcA